MFHICKGHRCSLAVLAGVSCCLCFLNVDLAKASGNDSHNIKTSHGNATTPEQFLDNLFHGKETMALSDFESLLQKLHIGSLAHGHEDHDDHEEHGHEDHDDHEEHGHEDHDDHEEHGHEEHGHEDHDDHEGHDHHEDEHDDHEDHQEDEHEDHINEHDDHDDHEEHGHHEDEHDDHENHREDEHEHDDHRDEHVDHENEPNGHGDEHDDHGGEHDDHGGEHDDHGDEHDDHEHDDEDLENDPMHHCHSAEELLHIHAVKGSALSQDDFKKVCPALVQQYVSKSCEDASARNRTDHKPTIAERYGYGTLACAIISYLPLLILLIIPKPTNRIYPYIMHTLIALGASTLVCDAMLHLLPAAMGVGHNHGAVEDEHDHASHSSAEANFAMPTMRGLVFLCAIYSMYILEMLVGTWLRVALGLPPANCGGHGHSHGPPPTTEISQPQTSEDAQTSGDKHENGDRSFKQCAFECIPTKSFGWMLILGDGIHNFMDGLAIGAAFSRGIIDGVATSLAVLFHEIPHELGDCAALIASGMTWRGAITWNIIQTVTAFIGLYVGLGIGHDAQAQAWIFAFTAGIFFHVSIGGLIPELHQITKNFWIFFIVQNLGIQIGFWAMFLIAIYEDSMKNMVKY